jgi:hypothetical protein
LHLGWREPQWLKIAGEPVAFVSRSDDSERPQILYLIGFCRNELLCELKVQAPIDSEVAKLPNVILNLLENEFSDATPRDTQFVSTTASPETTGKQMIGHVSGSPATSTEPAEAWYLHGQNRYRFRIPAGWKRIDRHRNTQKDQDFDTIQSPDGRYKVVCSRLVRQVGESDAALDDYREGQVMEVAKYAPLLLVPFQIASAPALRIGYQLPNSEIAIWRMAVVYNKERFVLNLIIPKEELDEGLPKPIEEMLGSLVFQAE